MLHCAAWVWGRSIAYTQPLRAAASNLQCRGAVSCTNVASMQLCTPAFLAPALPPAAPAAISNQLHGSGCH